MGSNFGSQAHGTTAKCSLKTVRAPHISSQRCSKTTCELSPIWRHDVKGCFRSEKVFWVMPHAPWLVVLPCRSLTFHSQISTCAKRRVFTTIYGVDKLAFSALFRPDRKRPKQFGKAPFYSSSSLSILISFFPSHSLSLSLSLSFYLCTQSHAFFVSSALSLSLFPWPSFLILRLNNVLTYTWILYLGLSNYLSKCQMHFFFLFPNSICGSLKCMKYLEMHVVLCGLVLPWPCNSSFIPILNLNKACIKKKSRFCSFWCVWELEYRAKKWDGLYDLHTGPPPPGQEQNLKMYCYVSLNVTYRGKLFFFKAFYPGNFT